MGLKPGMTNNPRGRPKGTKNKMKANATAAVIDILDENLPRIRKAIKAMPDSEAVNTWVKLALHIIPRPQAISLSGQLENRIGNMTDDEVTQIVEVLTSKIAV